MDERADRGEFYPGGDSGGGAPAPQQSDKVDRVNLGELGESYTLKDVKQKVNQIVRVIAPARVGMMLMLAGAIGIGAAGLSPRTLRAAAAPLEDIPNTSTVVTNEEDAVAMATLATATNALQASTSAAMSELRSDINTASNNLATAIGEAIASESNRVEATYAKRSEIPAAPDLAPYALKSELPTDYITENDITNFATRAWISAQGWATEAGVNAQIDAQNLAIGAATNAQNAAIAASSNALAGVHAEDMAKIGAATNALKEAMSELRSDMNERIEAIEITGGNTRLWTSDAKTYQDATGVVWQVQVATSAWTVVHSWTTNDVNWVGPFWWGEEGAGEDYYEGPGWYISSSGLTTMKMSEDIYESQIVMDWTYWGEEAHSITTTCSRTVQWLTNAVERVQYRSDVNAASNGVIEVMTEWVNEVLNIWGEMGTVEFAHELSSQEEGVDNVRPRDVWGIARSATNYTDAATNALAGAIGRADLTEATNYTDSVAAEFENGTRLAYEAQIADNAYEADMARTLGEDERYTVRDIIGAATNAARAVVGAATNGLPEAIGRKQDRLPYPTNAIPFSAIDGAPSGGGQEWSEVTVWTEGEEPVHYVTNGMMHVNHGNTAAFTVQSAGWPNGAAMYVDWSYNAEAIVQLPSNLRLVGYGTWPTNNFQSVWWRSGTKIFVNVLLEE